MVFITGIGVVTRFGAGKEALLKYIQSDSEGLERLVLPCEQRIPSHLLQRVRKMRKIMDRVAEVGFSSLHLALLDSKAEGFYRPEEMGLFIGAPFNRAVREDLKEAVSISIDERGEFDIKRFGGDGIARTNPLFLLKGLSNNVQGIGSSAFGIKGFNTNYCMGGVGGLCAIINGIECLSMGRVRGVLAGGYDSLISIDEEPLYIEPHDSEKLSEGGAFFFLEDDIGMRERGATPYAFVSKYLTRVAKVSPPDFSTLFSESIREFIYDFSLEKLRAIFISTDSVRFRLEDLAEEDDGRSVFSRESSYIPLYDISRDMGFCGGAGGVLSLAVAVTMLSSNQTVPGHTPSGYLLFDDAGDFRISKTVQVDQWEHISLKKGERGSILVIHAGYPAIAGLEIEGI